MQASDSAGIALGKYTRGEVAFAKGLFCLALAPGAASMVLQYTNDTSAAFRS